MAYIRLSHIGLAGLKEGCNCEEHSRISYKQRETVNKTLFVSLFEPETIFFKVSPMHKAIFSSWPLFFGLALMMVGNGLQGTLLGVRASLEGFDTTVTGLIMSLYYAGFLIGSYLVPKLVSGVGHIRVFAALASLASTTVLLHGLFPNEWIWAGVRILTGFSYAGLYIVVESWLNNMSTNKTRGKILGLYLFITFGGMALGQLFLNLADPQEMHLFVLTSVLVSMALLPISLSRRPAPDFDEPEHVSLRRLYIMSPLGLVGAFVIGLGNGTMFGLGAVFATEAGMSFVQVSTFMAIYIMGGVAFQIPIGWLSDHYDRRKILIIISLLSALSALVCFLTFDQKALFYFSTFFYGGLSLTLYGLCLAHTNDHLTQRQILGAGASLILVNGAGACIGPLLTSVFMSITGTHSFFPMMSAVFALLFGFGILRTQMRDPVPLEEQSDYVAIPARTTPMVAQIVEEDES